MRVAASAIKGYCEPRAVPVPAATRSEVSLYLWAARWRSCLHGVGLREPANAPGREGSDGQGEAKTPAG